MGGCVGSQKTSKPLPNNQSQPDKNQPEQAQRVMNYGVNATKQKMLAQNAPAPQDVKKSHQEGNRRENGGDFIDMDAGRERADKYIDRTDDWLNKGLEVVEEVVERKQMSPNKNYSSPVNSPIKYLSPDNIPGGQKDRQNKRQNWSNMSQGTENPKPKQTQSNINVVYTSDLKTDPINQNREEKVKQIQQYSGFKAISEVPSYMESAQSNKINVQVEEVFEFEKERQKLKNSEYSNNMPRAQSEPIQKKERSSTEVKPLSMVNEHTEEKVHQEQQFLEAYQQGLQIPIFQISISG